MAREIIVALVSAAFLVACGEGSSSAHPVVGRWSCIYSDGTGTFNTEITFRTDGSTSQRFSTAGVRGGSSIKVEGEIEGKWEDEGGKIYREDRLSRTTYVEIDGQPLPSSEFQDDKEIFQNSGRVDVTFSDANHMTMGTGDYTYCERAS